MSRFNPFNNPICFLLPLNVGQEAGWIPHAPFAMVLVDLLRPQVIVELGGRDGVSYGVFCQAVMELQLESRCFAISYHRDEDENGAHEIEPLNGFHDELYRGFSRRIQSSRSEALALFEDHTIDLLHIVPGTSYPDAKRSLETWLPKLSDRGVVLLSDTNFHAGEGGLWKLWTEIKDDYPHFEFEHERGLGLLSIGASPSDKIKQLLEAHEPDVSLIREFFRQQGQRLKVWLEKDREIKTLLRQAQDREQQMLEISAKLEGSQRHEGVLLKELDAQGRKVEALATELTSTSTHLQAILNSRAWRWVSRYGRLKMRLLASGHRLLRLPFRNGRIPSKAFRLPTPIDLYDAWLEVNEWNQRRASLLKERLSKLAQPPVLTVIIPVNDQSIDFPKKAIESVVNQAYQNWELLIVEGGNHDPKLESILKHWVNESRVKRITANENISRATSDAIASADGDYLVYVGQADELTPDALGEVALYLDANPQAQILYADHDRIDPAGVRHDPQFKADWALALAENEESFAPFLAIKRTLALKVWRLLDKPEGPVGRFLESKAREENWNVAHIPQILSHQRCRSQSSQSSPAADAGRVDDPLEPQTDEVHGNSQGSPEPGSLPISARTIAPRTLEPIRTLMCAFNLNWEGAPHSQYEMTVKLKQNGIIDPLVYSPSDGPLRQEYERQGIEVRVREHPLVGVSGLPDYETRIDGFAKWIKNWQVELVYGNTLQTFYAIEAAHHLNLPSVWNPRESDPWQTYFDFLPPGIANRALQCFSYPYEVVFVSNATLKAFQPLNSRHNFIMIHNGLNRERFDAALRRWPREAARKQLGVSEPELLVLLLGTVCEWKGQIDLVEAMRQLSDQNVASTRFLIVGDRGNDYSEQLRRALRRLPYSRRTRLEVIPETADAALYYAAADIFVCTSRVESFPRVILEALAARLPIITTPVFGIAEQVQENTSALFYEPGDVETLAKSITALIEDRNLRQRLAANARPALNALMDFDSMVDSYAEVFREAWLSGATRARKTKSCLAASG